MTYKQQVTKAMTMLGQDPRVVFLGQSIAHPGHVMFQTLENVPMKKRIELPVAEDMQMGMCIGLSLEGYIPVSIYPRMDFLILAMNQLVNHLDKIERMSNGEFKPKVIIRTMVGSKEPLDAGLQHTSDYTEGLVGFLNTIPIVRITDKAGIVPIYATFLAADYSTIVIEMADLYDK